VSAQAILYYIVYVWADDDRRVRRGRRGGACTGSDKLDSFLGLQKRNPWLAAVLLVLFLSLAGIPPLVGFWAKFNLFAAVLTLGSGPLHGLGRSPRCHRKLWPSSLSPFAFSAVSLYYYLQVLKRGLCNARGGRCADQSASRHDGCAGGHLLLPSFVMVCFPALLQSWIASFYA